MLSQEFFFKIQGNLSISLKNNSSFCIGLFGGPMIYYKRRSKMIHVALIMIKKMIKFHIGFHHARIQLALVLL